MTATDTSPNADQIAFWNDVQGAKWVRLQKQIDAMLRPFGAKAVARLGLRPGHAVLDVGCGTGETSFDLADKVGPTGEVTGIDVSRPMLDRARARASTIPELNLTFVDGDVQTYAFPPDRFDSVFSRFGVMFFTDPVAAFANMWRTTRPGGRLAFACWREPRENEWISVSSAAVRRHAELPPRPAPGEPGQFSLADQDGLSALLSDSGWSAITIDRYDTRLAVGRSLDEAVDYMAQMGPAAQALVDADDALRQRVSDSLREAFAPFAGDGAVRLGFSSWIVSARKE